jgi:hypothetical protein
MRPLAALVLSLLIASPTFAANNIQFPRGRNRLAPGPNKTPHLLYYGGKVLSNVKIVLVYWGAGFGADLQRDLPAFYQDLVTGPMFDWLTEYDTAGVKTVDGRPSSNQHIGHGSYFKAVTITPSIKSNPLRNADLKTELAAQIAAGHLPKPDANTLYMVHFPPGLKVKLGNALSCKSYCAFHDTDNHNIYYGAMPDQSVGSGCETSCGNAGPFGNLTATASHEVIEAVTDAQVGDVSGKGARFPMAWYDANKDKQGEEYAEIGDICSDYLADMKGPSGRVWKVQKMWSNQANGCIATRGDQPVRASTGNPSSGAKGTTKKTNGKSSTPARRPLAG